MLPPLPRCSGWAYSSLISPGRVILPRKGHRVGLHIVLFEVSWRVGASDRFARKVKGLLPPILELTMNITTDQPGAPTAIRTELGAIFVSLELSRSSWLVTSLSPSGGEKMSKHAVRGGDGSRLLERFLQLREKARARTGKVFP